MLTDAELDNIQRCVNVGFPEWQKIDIVRWVQKTLPLVLDELARLRAWDEHAGALQRAFSEFYDWAGGPPNYGERIRTMAVRVTGELARLRKRVAELEAAPPLVSVLARSSTAPEKLSKCDKPIVSAPTDASTAAAMLGARVGKVGGPARAKRLTPEHRSAIAREAAVKRWAKRKPLTGAERGAIARANVMKRWAAKREQGQKP